MFEKDFLIKLRDPLKTLINLSSSLQVSAKYFMQNEIFYRVSSVNHSLHEWRESLFLIIQLFYILQGILSPFTINSFTSNPNLSQNGNTQSISLSEGICLHSSFYSFHSHFLHRVFLAVTPAASFSLLHFSHSAIDCLRPWANNLLRLFK